jgi:hypothetical protein
MVHRSHENRRMKSGRYTAQIPHRRVFYSPNEKRRWDAMWEAWKNSDRKDPSVWQEFRDLLRTPGFAFFRWGGGRFAESVVALELVRAGYKCFHACRLFRYGKKRGVWLEPTERLEAVLEEAGLPLPDQFTKRIKPQPRNPDLAAYFGSKWHFCEVKFNLEERMQEGQLEALAVLQKLLDATVEVVRVVDEKYRNLKEPPPYHCEYTIT